jgi:hypothetical protein
MKFTCAPFGLKKCLCVYNRPTLVHSQVLFTKEILQLPLITTKLPGPKIIKLRMETSLKAQGSDWLVAISSNQMLEI